MILSCMFLQEAAESNAEWSIDIWGKGGVPRITDPQQVPGTLEEIWAGYNKSYDVHNPLEVKIHKTWAVDGGAIVVNWVQITLGAFQGKKSIVCGYWAYPKGVGKDGRLPRT